MTPPWKSKKMGRLKTRFQSHNLITELLHFGRRSTIFSKNKRRKDPFHFATSFLTSRFLTGNGYFWRRSRCDNVLLAWLLHDAVLFFVHFSSFLTKKKDGSVLIPLLVCCFPIMYLSAPHRSFQMLFWQWH